MDVLDLPQLADRSGLPLSLARYYRDRFILFVPSIRFGRRLMHPVEAIDAMIAIRDLAASGLSVDAIQSELEERFPVTVVNAQEISAGDSAVAPIRAMRALANEIDERSLRVELEVAMLREQLNLSSQSQVAALAELSRPVELPQPIDHTDELRELRASVAELRDHVASTAQMQVDAIAELNRPIELPAPVDHNDELRQLRSSVDGLREQVETSAVAQTAAMADLRRPAETKRTISAGELRALQTSMAELKEQVAASSQAHVEAIAEIGRPTAAQRSSGDWSEEFGQVRSTIEELRAHVSLLASRDQLEWIGDVVAAAALRPPQGAMDAAIERRLHELQEQIQEIAPESGREDLGELRTAVDRLTQQSGSRDQEMHRAFQTLIGAVRKEIATVHGRLAELKRSVELDPRGRAAIKEFPVAANGPSTVLIVEANGADANGDRSKSRAPRRLGQPLRGGGIEHDETSAAD